MVTTPRMRKSTKRGHVSKSSKKAFMQRFARHQAFKLGQKFLAKNAIFSRLCLNQAFVQVNSEF